MKSNGSKNALLKKNDVLEMEREAEEQVNSKRKIIVPIKPKAAQILEKGMNIGDQILDQVQSKIHSGAELDFHEIQKYKIAMEASKIALKEEREQEIHGNLAGLSEEDLHELMRAEMMLMIKDNPDAFFEFLLECANKCGYKISINENVSGNIYDDDQK